jgi:Aminoglycoside-2''-adenylyltransferase
VVVQAFEPDLSRWDAWRPAEVARRLAGVRAPWYVAADWAIDLFLGGQQRDHEDLAIAVPRDRFAEVAEALAGFELFTPAGRKLVRPFLGAGDVLDTSHQTWVREPVTGLWRLDVFREPSDRGLWCAAATSGSGFRTRR